MSQLTAGQAAYLWLWPDINGVLRFVPVTAEGRSTPEGQEVVQIPPGIYQDIRTAYGSIESFETPDDGIMAVTFVSPPLGDQGTVSAEFIDGALQWTLADVQAGVIPPPVPNGPEGPVFPIGTEGYLYMPGFDSTTFYVRATVVETPALPEWEGRTLAIFVPRWQEILTVHPDFPTRADLFVLAGSEGVWGPNYRNAGPWGFYNQLIEGTPEWDGQPFLPWVPPPLWSENLPELASRLNWLALDYANRFGIQLPLGS